MDNPQAFFRRLVAIVVCSAAGAYLRFAETLTAFLARLRSSAETLDIIERQRVVRLPQKTKIVYCKDANRRGDFPNQSLDFLGFSCRSRKTMWQGHIHAHGFMPAASPKALKAISRTIRRWTLHHRSDKALQDLAKMYNPYIQGWINYYGNFYRTQLRPTLKRIDLYVIRWARRKVKRF